MTIFSKTLVKSAVMCYNKLGLFRPDFFQEVHYEF